MTDGPMEASATEHPDEGMIHAWLDDALSAPEAARLEAHVQSCAECRARVAEARGLIAGASRIVAALDDVPAGTRPGWAQAALAEGGAAEAPLAGAMPAAATPTSRSLWRRLRVTPSRAALAATILVALGVTLTYQQTAVDSLERAKAVMDPTRDVPASTSAEGAPPMAAAPARDALLDSAVARRVAQSQGRSTVGPAPGVAVPQVPPPSPATALPSGAGEQVALGRRMEEARREAAAAPPDRARTRAAGAAVSRDEAYAPTVPPPQPAGVAGRVAGAAESAPAQADARADVAMMAKRSAVPGAACVRLESADADARWADQPFPLVLAFDQGEREGRRGAAVLAADGTRTELRATWTPRGGDSVMIDLRRIGWSGSIALGPDGGVRSGLAVSSPARTALEAVTVRGAPQAQTRAAAGNEPEKGAAAAAPRAAPAPAGPPLRELRVTARAVACPN